MAIKTCSKCQSTTNGFPSKGAVCKACVRTYKKQYYTAHRDRVLTAQQEHRLLHREDVNQRRRELYRLNPGPARARARAYQADHPDRVKAASLEYYAQNSEYLKGEARNYRQRNPRKVKSLNLRKLYGIDIETYEALFAVQNGRCKICDQASDVLQVDHCHTTGQLRGLLCRSCNWGLGHFKDSPQLLDGAIKYLAGA
jgi:hypothetical protein